MSDPLNKFEPFCKSLKINSKEYGLTNLQFWGTQQYYLDEIKRGIEDGIRFFLCLKGRQGGISTVSLALITYWMNKFAGTLGAEITDDSSNLTRFRSILTGFYRSLPRDYKVRQHHHNIYEWQLLNESVLSYLVAGKRQKATQGDLGQGKGLNLLHATECSSWGDEKQVDKLVDSLAENHPNRLYLFESTANGFNLWFDMCETAKKAKNQRLIFIGWWRHNLYRFERGSKIFQIYWDGRMTSEESRRARNVKQLYGFEIQPEQIAWWRYNFYEKKREDMNALLQEHPWTDEDAFIMSGYRFFSSEKLTTEYKKAIKQQYENYRYTFGNDFIDTRLLPTTRANAELKVWEAPNERGWYVLGADPAYGYNENSDFSTAIVYRCYADRMVEVAEFSAAGLGTAQFAWVLVHLVGTFGNVRVNLELTGPGNAVLNELTHVFKMQGRIGGTFANELRKYKPFMYCREDSLSKSFAYHSKTGQEQKEMMLNRMRDLWQADKMEIRSADHLTEMKYFARDGSQLEGRGGANDDRVIASALAVLAWIKWARTPLIQQNLTYEKVQEMENKTGGIITPTQAIIQDFLARRGITE